MQRQKQWGYGACKYLRVSATLGGDTLRLAVVANSCGYPDMVGVVAGRSFNVGDCVSSYGGGLRCSLKCSETHLPASHTRSIPTEPWALDGLLFSGLVQCNTTVGDNVSIHLRQWNLVDDTSCPRSDLPVGCKCFTGTPRDKDLRRLIDLTGAGYMMNAPFSGCGHSTSNVKVVTHRKHRAVQGVSYDTVVFYEATAPIAMGEQILVKYVRGDGNAGFQYPCKADVA